jgi:hypothetical protein
MRCWPTRSVKAHEKTSKLYYSDPCEDVDLLLSCLQETLNFEHGLEQRFANEVCWAQRTTEGLQRLHYLVTRLHRHLGLQGRQAAWVQSSHLGGFRAVHESLGRVSGQVSSV